MCIKQVLRATVQHKYVQAAECRAAKQQQQQYRCSSVVNRDFNGVGLVNFRRGIKP